MHTLTYLLGFCSGFDISIRRMRHVFRIFLLTYHYGKGTLQLYIIISEFSSDTSIRRDIFPVSKIDLIYKSSEMHCSILEEQHHEIQT